MEQRSEEKSRGFVVCCMVRWLSPTDVAGCTGKSGWGRGDRLDWTLAQPYGKLRKRAQRVLIMTLLICGQGMRAIQTGTKGQGDLK